MRKIFTIGLLMSLFVTGVVQAAELTGSDILTKMDGAMEVQQKYMEEEMVLKTASGSERVRTIAVWNKNAGEEDKMLLKFLSPANIEGTGFLMVGDDMWLYLPALGKVKRIAGSAKQGSFMGSDLSYEDMEALGNTGFSADYQARLLDKTKLNENEVYHLELSPKNGDTGYRKLEIWIDTEIFLPHKILYFTDNDSPVKKLITANHEQIDGHWTATKLEVTNLSRGSSTILNVKKVDFACEINDRIFSTRYLERGN